MKKMNRRTLLKDAGVALALPNLEMFADVKKPEKLHHVVWVLWAIRSLSPRLFLFKRRKELSA